MAVTNKLRFEILRRDRFRCRYCGASAADAVLEVDHVIPRARGGTDTPANLVAACESCNSGKTDRPLDATAAAEWDAIWQGEPGHSSYECRYEVLELAISYLHGGEVPA